MSKINKNIECPSPFLLNPSDNPGTPLVTCLLTGDNYSTWARAMKNSLNAKNKIGFVDGTLTRPNIDDPEFKLWNICSSMVIGWITNSLEKSLQSSVAYAVDARDLWEDLRERFSQGNAPRIFQLKSEISRLRQEGMSVSSYYTKLKSLWDEIEDYTQRSACTCGAAKDASQEKEVEKLYQFLMGLNEEIFGTIRSQILSFEPLPSLSKAYSIVAQEERRRMLTTSQGERSETS